MNKVNLKSGINMTSVILIIKALIARPFCRFLAVRASSELGVAHGLAALLDCLSAGVLAASSQTANQTENQDHPDHSRVQCVSRSRDGLERSRRIIVPLALQTSRGFRSSKLKLAEQVG